MKITKLEEDVCPNCGTPLNAAANFDGKQPKPGDYSICVECVAFLQFDDNLIYTHLTMDDLMGDEHPVAAVIELQNMRNQLITRKLKNEVIH